MQTHSSSLVWGLAVHTRGTVMHSTKQWTLTIAASWWHLGMLNDNRLSSNRLSKFILVLVFVSPLSIFEMLTCEYCIGCSRKCGAAHVNWPAQTQCTHLFTSVVGHNECLQDCLPITSQQLSHATHHYQQRTRKTAISHTSFRPCKAVVGRPSEIWSSLT